MLIILDKLGTKMKTVLGGGLSGLASAITLARNNEKVKVVERTNSIGKKFPESIHAFRNYGNSFDEIDFIKSRGFSIDYLKPIHKIVKFGPSRNPSEIYSDKKPLFYAVKRGYEKESIDIQLYEQAKKLQVDFQLGKTIMPREADIIATGVKFVTGIGYGYNYKSANVDEDTIIFLLDDNYAPKSYAYAIPYGKHEVSVVITSYEPSSFNKMHLLFDRLVEKEPIFSKLIEGAEKGPRFAKTIFYYLPETANIENKLLVGEAGGFVEADRGFGMHYALESGYLAAKALIDGSDYDTLWKRAFESQLLKAFRRRLILDKLDNRYYDRLINAGTRMSIEEYVRHKEEQNTDMVKKLLLNLHTIKEVRKLRKMYNIKKLYTRQNMLNSNPITPED